MLPSDNDVYLVLNPVYYLSCVVGVSTFSIHTFQFKPLSLLYTLLLSIPLGYNVWLMCSWISGPTEVPKTALFFILMNDTFIYSMAVVSWSMMILHYKGFTDTYKEVLDISANITRLGASLSMKKLRLTQTVYLVMLMILLMLKYSMDYSVDSGDSHWFGFYLADATNNIVIVQFTTFLWILKEFYHSLNTQMRIYLSHSTTGEGFAFSQKVAFHTPIKTIHNPTNNVLHADVFGQFRSVKDMRRVINSIYLLSQLLNGIYSLQLLLNMANFIIEITVSLYILYYNGVYKVTDEDLGNSEFWIYIVSQILVVLSDSFQIVTLINASEDVTDEVRYYCDTLW